jgi:glycosyltransferase involved in cell wall biosynthesis
MNEHVTCGIKTVIRDAKLAQCLESLVGKNFQEVIVVDDGPISEAKRRTYQHYAANLPLKLIELPYDSGVSVGRNTIVEHCRTEFLLLLDDDQIIPNNISELTTIVRSDPEIGGISGVWNEYGTRRCGATNLYFEGKFILQDIKKPPARINVGDLHYYLYDFIPNSTLFRTACLLDAKWEPYYKIGSEHIDFFLMHKRLGKWKFGITPNVIITHDPRETTTTYHGMFRKKQERIAASFVHFQKKWNVRHVHEIRRHTPLPNASVPRRLLTYRLSKLGLPYDIARKIAMQIPKSMLPRVRQVIYESE